MISIERFGDILDELAQELPGEFYDELNLGVCLEPSPKLHPQARGNDLYILGEYSCSSMGRGVVIYYGSFERLFGELSEDGLKDEIRKTLRHEFRHHMEGRAGERGLEIEDENNLKGYLNS
jgi:predicted Zn-dependent protease with MMP-like domain